MLGIGYWIRSLRDDDRFPPQEFVGDIDASLRSRLADHLTRGRLVVQYRGYSNCLFDCSHSEPGCELSDGRWIWPGDLAHYVRNHRVLLPEEFVEHVLADVPPVRWTSEDERSSPDLEFWTTWCRRNCSADFRLRLAAARDTADCEAERILRTETRNLERTAGTAGWRCHSVGCENRALAGKRICARCVVESRRDLLVGSLYHDLRSLLRP